MSSNDTAPNPSSQAPLSVVAGLGAAVIAACPTTPSAHAPWVWVTVVVIVVLSLRSKTLKQHLG
ncbi:hypothetical protein [Streptomyces acidiscabies]|uniref:hypothetical protein n=1 Tax=Streptomyces acidiscabies TaxID=42234 RepID=UPI0038F7FF83